MNPSLIFPLLLLAGGLVIVGYQLAYDRHRTRAAELQAERAALDEAWAALDRVAHIRLVGLEAQHALRAAADDAAYRPSR